MGFPLATLSLLLFQIQDNLNIQLAGFPIIPNQEETMKLREKVLSSVSAQDIDTSAYQMSDLDDDEFF